MTKRKGKAELIDVKELLECDEDFLQAALQALLQAAPEAEMTEAIGAEKGERTETRLAYRSGYYPRSWVTRVGTLELRVPQDRAGRFSTELFQRYQRSEKALVGALAEMYVQGVSTRKVKAVTEILCGHSFSASAISAIGFKEPAPDRKTSASAAKVERGSPAKLSLSRGGEDSEFLSDARRGPSESDCKSGSTRRCAVARSSRSVLGISGRVTSARKDAPHEARRIGPDGPQQERRAVEAYPRPPVR